MSLAGRLAGAPISWGICEVPGWGHALAADKVLAAMQALGLRATEQGPAGFLPLEPAAVAATLDAYGLRLVAGFVPVVLHRPELLGATLAAVEAEANRLRAAGADVLVVAAATGEDDYDRRTTLDEPGWAALTETLARVDDRARAVGLQPVLHPHAGTMIERPDEVDRLLGTTEVALCLDTGHLAIGGVDPVELAARMPERIGHVHLKDVDLGLATAVREGRLGYLDAVRRGLYRPLGRGDVGIAAVIAALEGGGYGGWYVLEQDVSLPSPAAADPAADVLTSIEFVREVERQLGTPAAPRATTNGSPSTDMTRGT